MNSSIAKKDFVPIGKIVGIHGVRGNCKILSFAEALSVFEPGSKILVSTSSGRRKTYEVNWAKPHSRTALLSLKEVNNRDQAKALVGSELYIEKSKVADLEDGSYYWFDLIGLNVFTIDEEYIGRLESIIPTGSNDVYVVKDDATEILIPALASVVLDIDLDRKRMLVQLPEGL